jgi:signal transduction histidine kinase
MRDGTWDTEIDRVAAVRALRLLDTPQEERFDRITRLAQHVLDVPIALVSLVDMDRQWFKSCIGLDHRETPRSVSFCSHAIRRDELMEVPDTREDPRFAHNPTVTEPPHARFYAGQPISASSGHRIGTLCVLDRRPRRLTGRERAELRDLAAWVELECAVVQSNLAEAKADRARQDFTMMVSHELRTPLTSVHGSLELLASGRFGELGPQADRQVRIAAKITDRLVRLADDVLDLSKVRSGELRLRLDDVDLAEVIDSAVHAVEGAARRRNVAVIVKGAPTTVRGDADRLVQAVTNLLANAVKVSPPDAPVEVCCGTEQGAAAIRIVDRGPGVPADQLCRIFEPFVRLDLASRGEGAGLGLTITRGIVAAHGGTVSAESMLGAGSTFTVTLPAAGPLVERTWW